MKPWIFVFFFSLFFFSCDFFIYKDWKVKIGDEYLPNDQVQRYCVRFSGLSDSLVRCDAYIQNWINRRLLTKEAIKQLDTNQLAIKIQENKIDLILGSFYQEVIQNEITASISETDMEFFYKKNKNLFLTEEPFLSIFLIARYKNDQEALKSIQILLENIPKMSPEEIDSFLIAHQINSYLHYLSQEVEYLSDLKQLLPILGQLEEKKFQKGSQTILYEDDYAYHIYVFDYQNKGQLPYHLAKKKIRLTILNEKKENYIQDLIVRLRNQAIETHQLKYR